MSATQMIPDHEISHAHPWVEVTERTDGHAMPFLIGVALFVASATIAILLTGLPH